MPGAEEVPMENRKPFAETLQALLDERGHDRDGRGQLAERVPMSQRELARRLEAELGRENTIQHTTIRKYFTGEMFPTRSAMERIAKVLRIDPNQFAEY